MTTALDQLAARGLKCKRNPKRDCPARVYSTAISSKDRTAAGSWKSNHVACEQCLKQFRHNCVTSWLLDAAPDWAIRKDACCRK